MNPHYLSSYLKCIFCGFENLRYHSFEKNERGESGAFVCAQCAHYYRLENNILDCLPPHVRDGAHAQAFERKYHSHMQGLKSRIPSAAEKEKSKEFSFEEAIPETYDSEIVDTAFWKKVLSTALKQWGDLLDRFQPEMILDVGCGTGRLANAFGERGYKVIALDATLPMLEIAQSKAEKLGIAGRVYFVLGDINHLPLRSGSISTLSFFGVFHHLEDPYRAFEKCLNVLAPKSLILGVDNNKSVFRKVFDALMRHNPLWHEDHHLEHAALSGKAFVKVIQNSGYRIFLKTTCFIPPQLYSLMPARVSDGFYDAADSAGSVLPFLRYQGGLLCIKAARNFS